MAGYADRHQYEAEQYAREARIARELGYDKHAAKMDEHAKYHADAAKRSARTGEW